MNSTHFFLMILLLNSVFFLSFNSKSFYFLFRYIHQYRMKAIFNFLSAEAHPKSKLHATRSKTQSKNVARFFDWPSYEQLEDIFVEWCLTTAISTLILFLLGQKGQKDIFCILHSFAWLLTKAERMKKYRNEQLLRSL